MMFQCTSDDWADFVSEYRTIQTEENFGYESGGFSLMHSWLKYDRGVKIATVRYEPDGNRMYYIDKDKAKEAEERSPHNRMFPR